MFRNENNVRTFNPGRFDPRMDESYRNENEQQYDMKRLIPWMVAVAISAAVLMALAEGYFA